MEKDETDRNPTWCTFPLYPDGVMEGEQCEHKDARGRYVVKLGAKWHGFDPGTKLQANFWVNGREERYRRIHWLCFACNHVMPLTDNMGGDNS